VVELPLYVRSPRHRALRKTCMAELTPLLALSNALCVLIGAFGLREDDRTAILSDQTKAHALIRRGVQSVGSWSLGEEVRYCEVKHF
jgi:hypothetical protein